MSSAFALNTKSTQSIMVHVMLALTPGTALMTYWLGLGVLINIAIITLLSVACEAVIQRLRKRSIIHALQDGSIVLAAWLLALCIPPSLPFTELAVGALAMSLLGKHVFGGLGQNPFNPAMVGYALLLISFPKTMTTWFSPTTFTDTVGAFNFAFWWEIKWHASAASTQWDVITQATPLDRLRTLERQNITTDTSATTWWPWQEMNIAWLLGGVFLWLRGIIRWHIPVTVLLSAAISTGIHHLLFPDTTLPVSDALLTGAMMFGAFFIATDPVTAPSSQYARLLYGAGIGLLTVALRTYSNYPEGFAFAVLLMNSSVPLLDRFFTRAASS